MKPPPDPLDPLLDQWSQPPEPSPRLSANVWQRIATSESTSAQTKTMSWWSVIEHWFTRPTVTMSFVAGCVLIGLLMAELRVNHLQRERSAQLARSYLLLIDPLLNVPASGQRS